jgi:hypothetical protein
MKRILVMLLAILLMTSGLARAEDPAPYKGISFEWEYGDYAAAAGFNIYREGVVAPVAVVSDRTARTFLAPMGMTIGETICFTMEVFDSKGNKSAPSEKECLLVPLPGVEMFLAFPKRTK